VLSEGAVICTLCGYNLQTGQKEPAANFLETSSGEEAAARKRWFRKRGSPMLETLDELLKLGLILFSIAAVGVWVWRLYKEQGGLSPVSLLPLGIILALLLAVLAPAAAAAINATVKLLRFLPRSDTYVRVALSLLFPFAGAMTAGYPGMEKSLDFLVPLTWFGGIGLLLYFLRAELIEWLISVATALAVVALGWLLLAGITSTVGRSAPLYAEMLPGFPWTTFTTGHAPTPDVTPAQPSAVAGSNQAATKPSAAVPAPPAEAPAPPTAMVAPSPPGGTSQQAMMPTPPPGPTVPTHVQPRATEPAAVVTPKVFSPLLTDVTDDVSAFKGISDLLTPTMPSSYFLVTRQESDDTTTIVECWSASPFEKKGATAFPYFAKKPASYAVSPKGDTLAALSYFPRSQLEFVYYDSRTPKKSVELNEPGATPTLLGFISPGQIAVRWDRGFESKIQFWNTFSGTAVARVITLEPVAPNSPMVLSPNGRLLAVIGRDRYLQIYDLGLGQVVRRIVPSNLAFAPVQLAFSPDNAQIAFYGIIEQTPTVVGFKVQNGEQVSTAVLTSAPATARGGTEGTADPNSFLWLHGPSAWLMNGTDLIDPATGRRFGTIEVVGVAARKQIAPGQLVFLTGEPSGKSFDAIIAKFDEGKVRSALEKLK
jgi:hypothetical protein